MPSQLWQLAQAEANTWKPILSSRSAPGDQAVAPHWEMIPLLPAESHRYIAAKSTVDEVGVEVAIPNGIVSSLHQVFDRAHFPTTTVDQGTLNNDITPMPAFKGVGLS